jgi:hypothetical protein
VYDNGTQPVYTLHTKSGKKITCTENHPILTTAGFRELGRLQEHDEVYTYEAPKHDTRVLTEKGENEGLSDMVRGEVSLQMRDHQGLSKIRGERDNIHEGLGSVREVFRRYGGAANRQAHARERRQQCWVLQRELQMGVTSTTGEKQAKHCDGEVQGGGEVYGGVGNRIRHDKRSTILPPTELLNRGGVRDAIQAERCGCKKDEIVKIERAGSEPTYGLYIHKSHSYISDEIVTHNTIPKHTIWAKPLRSVYVPPKGMELLNVDYSMGELKIAACVANEPTMLQAFKDGIDLHMLSGSRMAGYEWSEILEMMVLAKDDTGLAKKLKLIRQSGKPVNFGLIYGMSAGGLQNYAKVAFGMDMTLQETEHARGVYFETYSRLVAWHKEYKTLAHKQGFVTSPLGRRRNLPLIHSRFQDIVAKAERNSVNCVDAKTECLTPTGWKTYDELNEGDTIYTRGAHGYLEEDTILALNIYPDYSGDVYTWNRRGFNARVTPNHRWCVAQRTRKGETVKYVETAEMGVHQGIVAACPTRGADGDYSDDFIRLLGWCITDATYLKSSKGHNMNAIRIFQSEGKHADSIRALLGSFGDFSDVPQSGGRDEHRIFSVPMKQAKMVRSVAPDRRLTWEFVASLPSNQAEILISTMIDADGSRECSKETYYAVTERNADVFQFLCTLAGKKTTKYLIPAHKNKKAYDTIGYAINSKPLWAVRVLKRARVHHQYGKTVEAYEGLMWCPTTKNGSFIMRREGATCLTGNSPIQATLSDITFWSQAILYEQYPELWSFGMTHDALSFYIPEGEVMLWSGRIRDVMENLPFKETFGWEPQIQFTVDAEKSSQSLADMKEFEIVE